jgi:hypothetical protein
VSPRSFALCRYERYVRYEDTDVSRSFALCRYVRYESNGGSDVLCGVGSGEEG